MEPDAAPRRNWLFVAAAAIPCAVLLVFFGTAFREWWLITSKQIVVIPAISPGQTSAPEVPATRLVPFIVVSGMLVATFAYALLRRSTKALLGGYLVVVLGAALAYFAHRL